MIHKRHFYSSLLVLAILASSLGGAVKKSALGELLTASN